MADGCSIGTVDLDSLKRKPWIVKGQFLPCIFISFIYRHSLRGKNKYARIVLQNKKGPVAVVSINQVYRERKRGKQLYHMPKGGCSLQSISLAYASSSRQVELYEPRWMCPIS